MLVDSSNYAAGSTVTGAIRQASAATGTSFNYLLATAQVESGLNPQAGAATSSARGLFQFIEQTWLGTIKQSGAQLGYGRYADAISKTSSGHYQVTDPAMRTEILKLRNDPTANAVMAGAFTKANADYLATKLGRQPSEGELYIAHFLGAGGAARLISLAAGNPGAKATDYFPSAASANSSIFYDRATGRARSLAQVRDVLTARYDVARNDAVRAAQAASAAVTPGTLSVARAAGTPLDLAAFAAPPAPATPSPARAEPAKTAAAVPDTAGMTSAFAAATPKPAAPAASQIFHGLFQDTDRTAPVAAIVSELWTTPNAPPDGNGGAAGPPPRRGDMRNLFSDPGAKS
ncbi:MAG TPA: transglycosylase SLT domain-containing protein [Xanthobacteraceae bacterium]|nr:transglycosylase SLT domain-containing protein [Xanthobacteraceae bacterium]